VGSVVLSGFRYVLTKGKVMSIDIEDLRDLAEDLVGNWRKWDSFAWFDDREDREEYCIVYTHNRDSGLIDQSNHRCMVEELKPFLEEDNPDIEIQRHNHFLVGWVEGFVIKVYQDSGELTPAFAKCAEMLLAIEEHPILNEDDHSSLQCEVEWENFERQAKYVAGNFNEDLTEDLMSAAYDWLKENHENEFEDTDDKGAWIGGDLMREAFLAIGMTEFE